jgi:hypothetical protein
MAMPTSPQGIAIRITENPRSEIWQAPTVTSDLGVLLIGWITREVQVDAGVPSEVVEVLSKVLTRLTVVTFLGEYPTSSPRAPNQWLDVGGARVTVLTKKPSALSRPRPLPLVATRDANVAQELFRSAAFDWNQQAQLALLSEPGPPPAVTYDLVEQCVHRSAIAGAIRELRLRGILYPAVDGDFATLVSDDPAFAQDFERELSRACEAAGISFTITSEEEFRHTRWIG